MRNPNFSPCQFTDIKNFQQNERKKMQTSPAIMVTYDISHKDSMNLYLVLSSSKNSNVSE